MCKWATDYIAKSTNGTCWVPPIGMVYNGTYESKMDDDLGVALFQETYTKNVRKTPLTTNNFWFGRYFADHIQQKKDLWLGLTTNDCFGTEVGTWKKSWSCEVASCVDRTEVQKQPWRGDRHFPKMSTFTDDYPLVMTNIAIVKPWPIEIDGLPNLKMVIFQFAKC